MIKMARLRSAVFKHFNLGTGEVGKIYPKSVRFSGTLTKSRGNFRPSAGRRVSVFLTEANQGYDHMIYLDGASRKQAQLLGYGARWKLPLTRKTGRPLLRTSLGNVRLDKVEETDMR